MSSGSSGSFFGSIRQEIEGYIEARANLFQLEATDKMARITGVLGVVALISLIIFLVLLCTSLMAGYYFAQLLESNFYGFAIVAGFYLLILIILMMGRKKLATFIANKTVEMIFQKTSNPEE
jgi:uncharacterized membrane protein